MQSLIYAFLGLAFSASTVHAQPYYFRHYRIEDGLSNNQVNIVIQDKHGFMWFGTHAGLDRFDGYHFKHFYFESDNPTANNHVYALYKDRDGQIWVGGERGLYWYDESNEKLVLIPGCPSTASSIQMDQNHQLWFLSERTIYSFDVITKRLKRHNAPEEFNTLLIPPWGNGAIWLGSVSSNLYQYLPDRAVFSRNNIFSGQMTPAPDEIWGVFSGGRDTLFVSTISRGLLAFNTAGTPYKEVVLPTGIRRLSPFVRDIYISNNHALWLSTESGIVIYDQSDNKITQLRKKTTDPYALSDNALRGFCCDSEGGIWVGSYFGGVNYFSKQQSRFKKYFPDLSANSISGNIVREICADNDDKLWIATEDAGINKLDPETDKITQFLPAGRPGDIADKNVHSVMVDGAKLWVGTFYHGLDILDLSSGRVIKHYSPGTAKNQFKRGFVVTFLKTKKGEIYLGNDAGLYKYRPASDDFEQKEIIPTTDMVTALLEDHTGTVWIGTIWGGIYFFNPTSGRKGNLKRAPGELTSNHVTALFEDRHNNIWISTENGGVCVINTAGELLKTYSTATGLPSNTAFKTLEDQAGNLWISTSHGLASLNPATQAIKVFKQTDGLLTDQFNYNSGFRAKDGRLYFGCTKGMVSFLPTDLIETYTRPPLYITSFQADEHELLQTYIDTSRKDIGTPMKEISLSWKQSSFSIDFAALSYAIPEKIHYRYRLNGLQTDWTYLPTNRRVYYTGLQPGKYHFEVEASADNLWNAKGQRLDIRVTPPYWASPWAYILYALTTTTILYYLVRSYHQRLQIRKQKEIYEAKIDFFTNVAHEIKTPLTLIKGPLENLERITPEYPRIGKDVHTMGRNADRLMTLVQQILDFRQIEINGFRLHFTKVNVAELAHEVFTFFLPTANKKNLSYQFIQPKQTLTTYADEEALKKIFFNLFGNAVKYAKSKVQIILSEPTRLDNHLLVEISNDGFKIPNDMREKVFEPFSRLKEAYSQSGTGIGLALARSLAELHQGKVYLKENTGEMNVFILELPIMSK